MVSAPLRLDAWGGRQVALEVVFGGQGGNRFVTVLEMEGPEGPTVKEMLAHSGGGAAGGVQRYRSRPLQATPRMDGKGGVAAAQPHPMVRTGRDRGGIGDMEGVGTMTIPLHS